jgi:hypothetical protein
MTDLRCGKCYKPHNIFDLKMPDVDPVFNYIRATTPEQSVQNFEQCVQKLSCKDTDKVVNDCCKYLPYDVDCRKMAEKYCSGEKMKERFQLPDSGYLWFFGFIGGILLVIFLALSIKGEQTQYTTRRYSDLTKIY